MKKKKKRLPVEYRGEGGMEMIRELMDKIPKDKKSKFYWKHDIFLCYEDKTFMSTRKLRQFVNENIMPL